jgi:murein DD-endopeptidase MepM/ murein hydrolase activator NlpD
VPEIYRPTNAHDAYQHSLVEANLSSSALARDWVTAATTALRQPVEVSAPFRETGYFAESAAGAVGYLFSVRRGQRIDAKLQIDAPEPLRIFMDLFRLLDDDPQALVHVATGAPTPIEPPTPEISVPIGAPESIRTLRLEPLRDGTYVLRIQPELLRNARWTVLLTADASLAFPVSGHTTQSIQSGFGADREAGRRSHRGVDIFARRGTPVLAASDGVVTRANTTAVGGNVVWVNDASRNLRLYYAHLDSHTVTSGQRVKAGDQLGTVGNTGNAITTPPHLHFGVYARGAVDPFPFLERLRTQPQELTADAARLGAWSRTVASTVELLVGPGRRARVLGTLDTLTPVKVWGASARWYRVTIPDGRTGYLAAAATEPATPLRSQPVVDQARVLDRPMAFASVIDQLSPGVEVPVLGSFGDFLYIQTPAGRHGWLAFE